MNAKKPYPKQKILDCPECDGRMILRKSNKYPRPFYGCTRFPKCRATHGAHPNGAPLGIPANAETKQWRIKAHTAFDPLWGRDDQYVSNRQGNRIVAYRWLAHQLGIPDWQRDCHIGMFNIEQCQQVIAACTGVSWQAISEWHHQDRAQRHRQEEGVRAYA